MEIAHVGRGIIALGIGQHRAAPIRALLLFADLLAQQFLDDFLEAMPVRIGAAQPRGDLGAIDRSNLYAQIMPDRGDIEPAEVKDLEAVLVGDNRLEVRRVIAAARPEPHQMLVTAAVADLHHA